ncbi:cytochrome c551 [Salirhabdus euzebyi]|uniref:Cytochrome c551 n=1 Tax=Salirhabdus euzebyi TaxID=394506 RepID=A0A841Q5E8_9BACI|nr:cytochrome c [Salirhabdus euzebyi]MBB6453610.1 cytochrome c551 [Salirhabdus euzebyi]
MKMKLLALLFGSALVLAACGGDDNAGEDTDTGNNDTGTEQPADDENAGGDTGAVDTAAAEKIYQNNCSMCHGADLSGGAGKDLREIGAKYNQEQLVDIIHNGIGGMQGINISDEDANTVAAWLATKK